MSTITAKQIAEMMNLTAALEAWDAGDFARVAKLAAGTFVPAEARKRLEELKLLMKKNRALAWLTPPSAPVRVAAPRNRQPRRDTPPADCAAKKTAQKARAREKSLADIERRSQNLRSWTADNHKGGAKKK